MELFAFLALTLLSALGADVVDTYVTSKKKPPPLPPAAPWTSVTLAVGEPSKEVSGMGGGDISVSAPPGGSVLTLSTGGTPGNEAPALSVASGVATVSIPKGATPGYYGVNIVWKAPDGSTQTTLLRVLVPSQAQLHPPIEITPTSSVTLTPGSKYLARIELPWYARPIATDDYIKSKGADMGFSTVSVWDESPPDFFPNKTGNGGMRWIAGTYSGKQQTLSVPSQVQNVWVMS